MLVFGTQIHIVTFIFILLEFGMLVFQFALYLIRPEDENRRLFMFMLVLMLLYNITGGLLPDRKINIPLKTQEIIAYGSGFLIASFFPYYFYRAFNLRSLRWHAIYGVPLFLILPYILFFVIMFSINEDSKPGVVIGLMLPFIYALILLGKMFSAIREKRRSDQKKGQFLEGTSMYVAISPWASLTISGFVEESQLIETLCTNTGIIAITFLFIYRSVKLTRSQFLKFRDTVDHNMTPDIFDTNCLYYRLTKTETAIALAASQGLNNRQIAESIFVSEETVKKHISNIYRKTNVHNRAGLFHKLNTPLVTV